MRYNAESFKYYTYVLAEVFSRDLRNEYPLPHSCLVGHSPPMILDSQSSTSFLEGRREGRKEKREEKTRKGEREGEGKKRRKGKGEKPTKLGFQVGPSETLSCS